MDKMLIHFGGEVELKQVEGTLWHLRAPLVLFGDGIKTADFDTDWFAPDTDYDLDENGEGYSSVYFNHGKDSVIGKSRLGRNKGKLSKDERAVWIEHHLDYALEYDAMVIDLINSRKAQGKNFGMSSGVPAHLIELEHMKDGSRKIKKWALGADSSVTLIPNDWRHTLIDIGNLQPTNVKSLLGKLQPPTDTKTTTITFDDNNKPVITLNNPVISSTDTEDETEPEAQHSEGEMPSGVANVETDGQADEKSNTQLVEVITMTEEIQNTPPPVQPETDSMKARLDSIERMVSDKMDALTKMLEDEPRINRSGFVTVDGGVADKNIKNASDMLLAVKRGDITRLTKHYGLKAQTENDGTTGGYYVPDQVLQDVLPGLRLTSNIGQLVTRIPVAQPSGEMPIRDYSRTPTANNGSSASAQGIESQARSEGGAYSEETIYFEMLQYRVTDATSGYVKASRELSQDFMAIEGLLRNAITEDVANKEEYFILRGNGVNQPLGVINWGGLVTATEDTDNTFAVEDSDEMLSKLLVTDQARIMWVHHPSVIPSVAKFERGTGGAVYHSNLAGVMPEALHGYGRMNTQHLPSKNGTNDHYCVLGDWSRYFIFERGGLYIEFSEHADFLNGNNVWRFGKRFDGKPAMTSAVTLADGTFTQSPFVAILDGS